MKQIIISLAVFIFMVGCTENNVVQPNSAGQSQPGKMVTILGTYAWDIENGQLETSQKSDFWYQRVDDTHGNLIARNGTTIEIVKKSYTQIDKNYMKQFPVFRDGRISNSDLKVGTVAVFKTAEGHYGKLKIKGFRALHDFDFPEAQQYLDQSWRNFVLGKPNTKKYHLMIEYQLYR